MTTSELFDLAVEHREQMMLAGLAATALVLLGLVWRAVRGGRPDRWVDSVAFLAALAFSAEGMWEVATQQLGIPRLFAALVFFLFEAQLVSAMFRASRYQRLNGNPGRHGRAVWLIAAVMGLIVAFAADTFVEAPLRLAIPLLAAYQWWLGLTADGLTAEQGAISWRWTPRRLLLWVGAIEPGERDVVTVDRERRTAQLTALEHRRVHGVWWLHGWRTARLARLSLTADDDMIAEVRRRVARAGWFVSTPAVDGPDQVDKLSTPDASGRKRHPTSQRRVELAHRRTPTASDKQLADRLKLSTKTVARWRPPKPDEPGQVNGHQPDLQDVAQ